jgi:hypothetical protein
MVGCTRVRDLMLIVVFIGILGGRIRFVTRLDSDSPLWIE